MRSLIIFGDISKNQFSGNLIGVSPIGYSYTTMLDLTQIVVPVFFWLSGVCTLLIIRAIRQVFLGQN